MSPRDLQACEMFQPAEKACWEILLRDYPDYLNVPPDLLATAMEETLNQLWAILRASSAEDWLKTQGNRLPLSPPGDCAMRGLMPYFTTGRHALELIAQEFGEILPNLSEPERERTIGELAAAYNVLVHRQLQACCDQCLAASRCELSGQLKPSARPRMESSEPENPAGAGRFARLPLSSRVENSDEPTPSRPADDCAPAHKVGKARRSRRSAGSRQTTGA